jgi:hypothetical protein
MLAYFYLFSCYSIISGSSIACVSKAAAAWRPNIEFEVAFLLNLFKLSVFNFAEGAFIES